MSHRNVPDFNFDYTTAPILSMKEQQWAMQLIPICMNKAMSGEEVHRYLTNSQFDMYCDIIGRGLVHQLRVFLLGEQHRHSYTRTKRYTQKFERTYRVGDDPINWWQMLKRDHFPEWFKRRWPVKTFPRIYVVQDELEFPVDYVVENTVTKICPHNNIHFPDKRHILFVTSEPEY